MVNTWEEHEIVDVDHPEVGKIILRPWLANPKDDPYKGVMTRLVAKVFDYGTYREFVGEVK